MYSKFLLNYFSVYFFEQIFFKLTSTAKGFVCAAILFLLINPFNSLHAQTFSATKGSTQSVRVINFKQLASIEAASPVQGTQAGKYVKRMTVPQNLPLPVNAKIIKSPYAPITNTPNAPPVQTVKAYSPAPASSFAALEDNGTFIPPDTHGAAGPNHLMITLNSQVRIQNRSGGTISTVTLSHFFFGNSVFDPKVNYDPYAGRWILVVFANANSATSGWMIAVSANSDPTGNWTIYGVEDFDNTNTSWIDYPSVGFNKNWIVIQGNRFAINGGFKGTRIYALTKSEFYAGGFATWRFWDRTDIGATQSPAVTYSTTLNPIYLLQNWNGNSGGNGFIRVYTIDGTVGSETLTYGPFISTPNPWAEGGVNAPQFGDSRRIDNGDSRMMAVVYRNGSLWSAQNAFLPASAPSRTSVQWWQVTPAGTLQQFGRIDDPGGTFYHAFPSISVNSSNDALIGYSRFSAGQFASCNYSFRLSSDPINTVQPTFTFKSGEASYFKDFGTGENRWGDFSATVVDPINDQDLWTIQEYAASPSNQWGTWWARVSKVPPPTITSFAPANGAPGTGVMVKGNNFINVSAVRINGVASSQIYVASSTLLYASVPSGASTGQIKVETQGGAAFSASNFTVAPISSSWIAKTGLTNARSQHAAVAANGKIYVFGGFNSSGLLTSLEIYNPSTNSWIAGAPMPTASRGMSFALGSNGAIYAVSGFNTSYSTQLFRYTPSTNTWATLASIPGAVWEGAAAATSNGKVYVFGGEPTTFGSTNATRIYDIASNTWSTGANIPIAVKQHSAVAGSDGKIYIMGGRSGDSPIGTVQIYNPSTNTWSFGSDMLIPKVQFGAVKANNGKIYVIGGKAQNTNSSGPFFHSVEIYTPSTNSWSVGPVLRAPVGELEAVNVDGNLYALGGTDGSYRNYNFQLNLAPAITSIAPTTGPSGVGVVIKGSKLTNVTAVRFNGVAASQFYPASSSLLYATVPVGATTGKVQVQTQDGIALSASNFTIAPISSKWVSRTNLITARLQHGTIGTNGKIYAFGGRNSSAVLSSLEMYDPSANSWSTGASMPVATRGMSVALGSNGSIYTFGGVTNAPVSTTYRYTPSTNTWTTLASMPIKVFEAAAAATSNGKIYVFGGEPSTAKGTSVNTTYIYDIAHNTWSLGANMPVGVQQHSAVTGGDGKIYIIGGRAFSANAPLGLVQIYNPTTNTWTTGSNMPIPKVQFAAVKSNDNRIYVIGGKASEPNSTGPFFHTVEIYDPSTNLWSTGPVLPTPLAQQTAAKLNDNIYAIAGTDNTIRNYNFLLIVSPVAPSALTASAASSTKINLKWKDNAHNESNYIIERANFSAGPFAAIASIAANSVSYSNTGLTAGKTYYYRVKASNSGGSSPYSNIASAKTPLSFENPEEKGIVVVTAGVNTLSVAPNPVHRQTTLKFSVDRDQKVQLVIFNMEGKVVEKIYEGDAKARTPYQFNWNVGVNPSGMYITTLRTEKAVLSEKMILLP